MRLLLIRHGQTPSNVSGILDAAIPGPGLTELGHTQAAAIPIALAAERIAGIHVSRMTRTSLTAAPLATAIGITPDVMPGLHEISAGDLQGRTDEQAVTEYLTVARAWAAGELDPRLPGADDGHAFFARYDADIAAIAGRYPSDATVAVVSHGAAIRVWTAQRAGNLETEFAERHHLDNTGAVVLEGSPTAGWTAVEWTPDPLGGPSLRDTTADDVPCETFDEATE